MAKRRPWLIILATSAGCVGTIASESGDGGGGDGGGTVQTVVSNLPCDVETVLSTRCWACHGERPTEGLPALISVAALAAPAVSDPTQSTAALALARMQSDTTPMPPVPATRATADEIATVSAWIAAGMPAGTGCAPTCTSNVTWTRGNSESPNMNPGKACIQCHTSDEGPRYTIAGTVYPTVHEPDLCDGADGANGAEIVITGADGRSLTLTPNAAGNFYSQQQVALPYQAKLLYMGRERVMADAQTTGDCNACHTQDGTNSAPGRIVLP